MAYVASDDFRSATLRWWTAGLALSQTEAPDADLSAAIAALSEQADELTNDHFEPTAGKVVDLDVEETTTRLFLPTRARAVTKVETRDEDGNLTVEAATEYRLHSSLDSAGTLAIGDHDWLEIIPGRSLSTGSTWPIGPQSVRVTYDADWAAVPERIKRLVSLMVYDHFRPLAPGIRAAETWNTNDAVYRRAVSEPLGIPEADQIIAEFLRPHPPIT